MILGYFKQRKKKAQADQFYLEAEILDQKNSENPYGINKLNKALDLYKKCDRLVNQPKFTEAIEQCKQKIRNCKIFLRLVDTGKCQVERKQYKEALNSFIKAENVFVIKEITIQISKCKEKIEEQEKYEQVLENSTQKARQGYFQEAINLIKPAIQEFSRKDGQKLLAKLERVIQAKDFYHLGLTAEKSKQFKEAKANYQKAVELLPEFIECNIRLSIILAKTKPKQAIFYLEEKKGEQAAYIRGFAYAQLGNWQQANKEWKSINNSVVNSQREIIQNLVKRDRLLKIKEIEDAVNNNNLEIAKDASLEFINNFGSEPTVKKNLEEHILLLLECQFWASHNWQQIASKTEQVWLDKQDITTLHNYAIAIYYQAQIDINNLDKFAIIWLTAIANFNTDPTLKNIPWLGSKTINLEEVFSQLKQKLDNTINTVKDKDLDKYLKLRDIYRRDMVALDLSQQNDCGIKIKQQLLILPGCYRFYRDRFHNIKLPTNIYGALYTNWGLAVAACYEGDIIRAIKIKPTKNPSSDADRFADCYISYHEGCYYLQNLEWRKAIKPLQKAKFEIQNKYDWKKEIDRLCELQGQQLDNVDTQLQFSKFWYELIDTQSARSYFVECKVRTIAEKLSNEMISCEQGLKELRELQKIDRDNYVVLELLKTLEFVEEAEEIEYLMKLGRLEDAVRAAKRSSNENIHFKVAEVCLKILLESAASNSLDIESMYQLGKWAYELCPHESAFQEIYSSLELYY